MSKSPDILFEAEQIASRAWSKWDRRELLLKILTTLHPQSLAVRLRDKVSDWVDILKEDWRENLAINERFINTVGVSLMGGIALGQKLGDWRIGAAAGAFGAFYIVGTSLAFSIEQQAEN